MALTWGDVRRYAARTLDDLASADEQLSGAISGCPVRLELARAWDEPWLLVISPVAPERSVSRPIDALRWSASMAIGGLVILDEELVVRAALRLADLGEPSLARYIEFVAAEAKRIASLHAAWGHPAAAVDFMVD